MTEPESPAESPRPSPAADPRSQQVEKILAALRQANPGAEESHRAALYSVPFDGQREWSGTIISKYRDAGQPQPATAVETVNDFAGLLVAELVRRSGGAA
jgi:hypothetical protein